VRALQHEEAELLLNELAQWAVLLFLGIMTLGLLRQLGEFLVPPRERVALSRGPKIGKKLPDELLWPQERVDLLNLMDERSVESAAIVVVDEECSQCKSLVDRLHAHGPPESTPIVAFSSESSPAHRAVLEEIADLVVVDPERLDKVGLDARPFILIVDSVLEVRHKEIGSDLGAAVAAWRSGASGESRAPHKVDDSALTLVRAEGSTP
jgi:hypothetical protein